MHWTCFHFEFEHGDYDPDEACDDPSCPWHRLSPSDALTLAVAFLRQRNEQAAGDIQELIRWMQVDEASVRWEKFVGQQRPRRRKTHDS